MAQIEEHVKDLSTVKTRLSESEAKLRETSGQLMSAQKTTEALQADINIKDKKIGKFSLKLFLYKFIKTQKNEFSGDYHQNAQQEKYTREAKETKIDELWVKVSSLTSDVKKKEELAAMLQKKVDDLSHGVSSIQLEYGREIETLN